MTDNYTTRRSRRQNKKEKIYTSRKSLLRKVLLVASIIFMVLFIVFSSIIFFLIRSAPDLEADNLQTPHSTIIYDQDKKIATTVFREENRVWIKIDDVPEDIKNAIISIEDKRFRDHHGIDFRRILGAAAANLKNGWGSEGGSTITQQVIKQSVLNSDKTLKRKVQEAWLAWKLERSYSKDQILELYLNNIYFGQRAYGIQTASETYFNKDDLNDLTISQTALLSGMPNAPSAYDPVEHPDLAEKRRNLVLDAMLSNQVISEDEADEAKETAIADILELKEKKENSPYHAFVDTVYEQLVHKEKVVTEDAFYQDGLKIYTTLDSKAQQAVYAVLHSEEIPYPDQDFETGIALVDTESGAVKAIGGGRNFKAISYKNYGSDVQRHPGSTIKPILDYAPAIEFLNWSTAHTLRDEPYQYSDGTPINEWDNKYWGDMSMRRALEWSRNIPALKALQATGLEKAQSFTNGLGIEMDSITESAALGSFDEGASPLQMAEAYAAFGNGGTYNEPFTVNEIVFSDGKKLKPENTSHQAMQDYTAYMITDMLKTVINSGTGTQANIEGIPVAGKTGSTNIPKEEKEKHGISDGLLDAWFAGYTPQHSLAIWTGYPSFKNEDGNVQYIQNDDTQHIAKRIFKEIMTDISDQDMKDFEKPDSVIKLGSELYIKGKQPAPNQKERKPSNKEDQEAPDEDSESKDEEDEMDEEKEELDDEKEPEEEKENQEDEMDEEKEEIEVPEEKPNNKQDEPDKKPSKEEKHDKQPENEPESKETNNQNRKKTQNDEKDSNMNKQEQPQGKNNEQTPNNSS